MKKWMLLIYVALMGAISLYAVEPAFASNAAISPDGNQVCFVYDSDLWLVPFNGGVSRRLTKTTVDEWNPQWSPDGKTIAFSSNREGGGFVCLIPASGGEAKVLIRENMGVSDWYSDSKYLLCTKYSIQWGRSFYKVPIDGSRPVMIAAIGNSFATLSPDNKQIVFQRGGYPDREAYKGSANGELWKLDIASMKYTKLTNTDTSELYPRFSHSSDALYYCAAVGEQLQVLKADKLNFKKAQNISNLKQFSARDISIARSNDRIVFEVFNELYTYDPGIKNGNKVKKLQIDLASDDWQDTIVRMHMRNEVDSYTVSTDEKLVAFNYKYDTFMVPRKGGDAKQVSFDHFPAESMQFVDKRKLILNKLVDGKHRLFSVIADSVFTTEEIDWFGKDSLDVEEVTMDKNGRWTIVYSDYERGNKLAIADSGFVNIRPIKTPWAVTTNIRFNDEGTYAVYGTIRDDSYIRELYLYDVAKEESKRLLSDDSWFNNLSWTKDNKSLLLSRGRAIYRLDLVPRDEFELDTDNWKEILAPEQKEEDGPTINNGEDGEEPLLDIVDKGSTPQDSTSVQEMPKKTELEIVWTGLEKRYYPVISSDKAWFYVLSVIDDSTFYYVEQPVDDNGNGYLKKINIYGKNSKEEFNFGKDARMINVVGSTVYYLDGGKLKYYNLATSAKKEVPVVLEYKYDKAVLNRRVFEEAWSAFGQNFYDPEMHGKSWKKLYEIYRPYVDKARSIDDIATIMDEMIGDVNASHTGFYPRQDERRYYSPIAYLGAELDYKSICEDGIRLGKVYPTSRLASIYKMKGGELLTHIDGIKIEQNSPVDSLLASKVGKRIKLRYMQDNNPMEAVITGLSFYQERELWYTDSVSRSKALVDKLSEGKLGYIHIPSMGDEDWEQFYSELFRENFDKDALVIDVRGNNGGHIHDQIISLLQKKKYAYSTSRRMSNFKRAEPRRIWDKPSIVLVDGDSFSDGEIFPVVYQELKLGKVVGTPSSGSVIGTWQYYLLDGSSMRLPGSGWYKLDGTNMEGTGAMPDIVVENLPEDVIAERDPQLVRAVQELMKELN